MTPSPNSRAKSSTLSPHVTSLTSRELGGCRRCSVLGGRKRRLLRRNERLRPLATAPASCSSTTATMEVVAGNGSIDRCERLLRWTDSPWSSMMATCGGCGCCRCPNSEGRWDTATTSSSRSELAETGSSCSETGFALPSWKPWSDHWCHASDRTSRFGEPVRATPPSKVATSCRTK